MVLPGLQVLRTRGRFGDKGEESVVAYTYRGSPIDHSNAGLKPHSSTGVPLIFPTMEIGPILKQISFWPMAAGSRG